MSFKPLIIDTHCHLDDERYDNDLDEVIQRAQNCGVRGILIPGADINDLPKAKDIAHKYDNIFFAAGVHPYHHLDFNAEVLKEFLKDEKCVAVGECGLDYYRLPKDENEKRREIEGQKEVFISHIKLALKYKKPLIVHVRESNQDSFDILKKYVVEEGISGVLHCFNASKLFLDLDGFYFAVGGVLTFSNAKELVDILPKIPKERLLFETDAPYLTPMPFRGKRNEPAYTLHVVEKASEILNLSFDETAKIGSDNAKRLFKAFNKAN
ncbi:MAG: TatD family hydrolase [Campylobacteraceae bacterium]|jgi:TatD DNase family protein|nr:TatD family hydrolase [Campylobacteraceae bacterium]